MQTSFEGLQVELRATALINYGPRDRVEPQLLQPQRDLLNQPPLNLEMPIHRHVQRELDDSSDEEIETPEHAGIRHNQVRNYNGRPDLGHFGGNYEY